MNTQNNNRVIAEEEILAILNEHVTPYKYDFGTAAKRIVGYIYGLSQPAGKSEQEIREEAEKYATKHSNDLPTWWRLYEAFIAGAALTTQQSIQSKYEPR